MTLANWLSQFDSHGIYFESVLAELEQFGITYDAEHRKLSANDRSVVAPVYSSKAHKQAIIDRGLGGQIQSGDWRGFTGYELAEALCRLLGLGNPGAAFEGRGFIFRACLKAIEEAKR